MNSLAKKLRAESLSLMQDFARIAKAAILRNLCPKSMGVNEKTYSPSELTRFAIPSLRHKVCG